MNNIVAKVKQLHAEIQQGFNTYDLESVNKLLKELGAISKTESYFSCLAALHFYNNETEIVKTVCQEGISKFPYSSSLHFNLGIILYSEGEILAAIDELAYASKYAKNEDESGMVNTKFEEIMNELIKAGLAKEDLLALVQQYKDILLEGDARVYPLDRRGNSLVRKVTNQGTEHEGLLNLYKAINFIDLDNTTRFLIKTERYLGKANTQFSFSFNQKSVIPISLIHSKPKLTIKHNGIKLDHDSQMIKENQFNCISFEAGTVEIESTEPIFVGAPISLKDEPKQKRLVVNLFVDGVAEAFLRDKNIEFLKESKKRFKEVYVNTNCYSTSDWTYPSIASVFTSKSVLKHGQYHPMFHHDFSLQHESFIEKLRKNGYYTTGIGGCWRTSPEHGYGGSFDRFVFKNSFGEFGSNEVLEEAIEHLEAFSDKNNYMWLVLHDLHDIPDRLFKGIPSQIQVSSSARFFNPQGETSALMQYNDALIERYKPVVEKIDFYIARFFDYIKTKYAEDEVLIIVHSDHGQGYLSTGPVPHLNENRTRVPFLMFGSGVNKMSDELMSILDIYPAVFKLVGESSAVNDVDGVLLKDFAGEGRAYLVTDNYHPDQPYRAMIKDQHISFFFETIDPVSTVGLVDLEKYKVDITAHNKLLTSDEIEALKEKYTDIAIHRILHLQKS